MRKLVVAEIPRDQLPDLTDPRWRYWSRSLRLLMQHHPVDWCDLEAFAKLMKTSDMTIRNLLAYLEGEGYSVSYAVPDSLPKLGRKVVWCGCLASPCPIGCAACPKVNKVRR